MSPATARWVRLISRNARIAKVNVASSAMARRLPTSTIAMSSLPIVYQLYAPTSFAANRSTSNPLQRKTSSPLLPRIRVMTLEPLRRHTGEEQRFYRPHSKYGAHQSRADADQRAKSTIGKCGVVELQVETPADESRVAQRRLDVAGEPRRHNRIGMNEYEGVAAGRRRADVHLTGAPA